MDQRDNNLNKDTHSTKYLESKVMTDKIEELLNKLDNSYVQSKRQILP